DVSGKLALENLACEDDRAILDLVSDVVAEQRAFERCRELRSEIAHFVRMAHQHQRWPQLFDSLFESFGITVGRVVLQPIALNRIDSFDFFRSDFSCKTADILAKHNGRDLLARLRTDQLGGTDGFVRSAVDLSLDVFDKNQNAVCHITSVKSD